MLRIIERICRDRKIWSNITSAGVSLAYRSPHTTAARLKSFAHGNYDFDVQKKNESKDELERFLEQIPTKPIKKMKPVEIRIILSNLIKLTKNPRVSTNLIHHEKFKVLSKEIHRALKDGMSGNQAAEIFSKLTAIGIRPHNYSALYKDLLQCIQKNINEIELVQALNLSQSLANSEDTTLLGQAIHYVLPTLFQENLHTQLNQLNDFEQSLCLNYVTRTQIGMPHKVESLKSIMQALLDRGTDISVPTAKSILSCLCTKFDNNIDPKIYSQQSDQLVRNSLEVMTTNLNSMEFDDLNFALIMVVKKLKQENDQTIVNIGFFKDVVDYVIEQNLDFSKALSVQCHFKEALYTSPELLNYLCEHIAINRKLVTEADSRPLLILLEAFEMTTYTPSNWNSTIWPVIESNLIYNTFDFDLNLIQITASLIVLDQYPKSLIEWVLSREFINELSSNEQRMKRSYACLRLIYCSVLQRMQDSGEEYSISCTNLLEMIAQNSIVRAYFPLQQDLENKLGIGKVLTGVKTKYGHVISHIVKIDVNLKEFLAVRSTPLDDHGECIQFEQLTAGDDEQLIAVIIKRFLINSDTQLSRRMAAHKKLLEKLLKSPVVFVNKLVVDNIDDEKLRVDYVIQQIHKELNEKPSA